MMSLVAWLFGSSTVPTGTLVWATDGMGLAIALSVMLLVTVAALALHHERADEAPEALPGTKTGALESPVPADRRLPSAA